MAEVNIFWNDVMIIGVQVRIVNVDDLISNANSTQTDQFAAEPIAVLKFMRKT